MYNKGTSKYIDTYNKIILKARLEQRKKSKDEYYEKHHILPRSLGGDNSKSNLILLTMREHFLAHYLLYKHYKKIGCFTGICNMSKAFLFMSNRSKSNSHSYSIARTAVVESMIGTKHSQQTKDRISESMKGIVCSEDKKKLISERNSKAIGQYTLDGIFIRCYRSAQEVLEIHGYNRSNISEVCRGKRKTAAGFIWKFV